MTKVVLALLTGCLFFATACDSSRLYETNMEFKNRSWNVSEKVSVEFEITDTVQRYNVYLNVRNSLDYPYSRIFVNYTLQDSTSANLEKKMIGENLFDQKTGEPFGQSGIGDLYDHQFPILSNYIFRTAGKYKITFEQFMRQDTLQGVIAVGARVESVETK
jgi:gliding motility-associated lipoprotein GldH